jgi:hypothetical protein
VQRKAWGAFREPGRSPKISGIAWAIVERVRHQPSYLEISNLDGLGTSFLIVSGGLIRAPDWDNMTIIVKFSRGRSKAGPFTRGVLETLKTRSERLPPASA